MPTEAIVTIVLAALGLIGILVKMLWAHNSARIEKAEKAAQTAKEKADKLDALAEKVTDLCKRVDDLAKAAGKVDRIQPLSEKVADLSRRHEDTANRFGRTIEELQEKVADARESISGFGADYVTRKEFNDARRELLERDR